MSFYKNAIDQTTKIIAKRSMYYRNLIVVITFVNLAIISISGLVWSWLPLCGLILLIPICGLYLYLDGKILRGWYHKLLGAWEKNEIDLMAFHEAIAPLTTLPQETVKSMLETLPTFDDLVTEQGISSSTRRAIAVIVNTINVRRCESIGFKTLTFTVIAVSIVLSAMLWKWQPFLAILFILIIVFMNKYLKIRRIKEGYRKIFHAKKQSDFDFEKFINIILTLNWQPFSENDKKSFIDMLVKT